MSYDPQLLQRIVEGALFAAGEALSIDRILSLFEEPDLPEKQEIINALQALQSACEGRGYELIEVASGWRFQVTPELAPWVNRLWEEKPQRYSRALLETLALIAYRQPITRSDIEEVRGVAVSTQIIKTLAEREWIKVVGHRDVPGRPALFATTRQFLDYFGLKSLEELPTLGELKDIDSLNGNLGLMDDDVVQEKEQIAVAQETDGDSVALPTLFEDESPEDLGVGQQASEALSEQVFVEHAVENESSLDEEETDQVESHDDIELDNNIPSDVKVEGLSENEAGKYKGSSLFSDEHE